MTQEPGENIHEHNEAMVAQPEAIVADLQTRLADRAERLGGEAGDHLRVVAAGLPEQLARARRAAGELFGHGAFYPEIETGVAAGLRSARSPARSSLTVELGDRVIDAPEPMAKQDFVDEAGHRLLGEGVTFGRMPDMDTRGSVYTAEKNHAIRLTRQQIDKLYSDARARLDEPEAAAAQEAMLTELVQTYADDIIDQIGLMTARGIRGAVGDRALRELISDEVRQGAMALDPDQLTKMAQTRFDPTARGKLLLQRAGLIATDAEVVDRVTAIVGGYTGLLHGLLESRMREWVYELKPNAATTPTEHRIVELQGQGLSRRQALRIIRGELSSKYKDENKLEASPEWQEAVAFLHRARRRQVAYSTDEQSRRYTQR